MSRPKFVCVCVCVGVGVFASGNKENQRTSCRRFVVAIKLTFFFFFFFYKGTWPDVRLLFSCSEQTFGERKSMWSVSSDGSAGLSSFPSLHRST